MCMRCGKVYCQHCFLKTLEHSDFLPCGCEVRFNEEIGNKMEEIFQKVNLQCPWWTWCKPPKWGKKKAGCNEMIRYTEFLTFQSLDQDSFNLDEKSHLSICPCRPISCLICSQTIQLGDMHRHRIQCRLRTFGTPETNPAITPVPEE